MPISPRTPRAPSSRDHSPRRAVGIAVVLLLWAAGCSSSDGGNARAITKDTEQQVTSTTTPAVFAEETFGVGTIVETRVDTSRPTKAHNGFPELTERTLPVDVYYPSDEPSTAVVPDAPASGKGPFPLLVFSHGVGAFGAAYQGKLRVVASAGYVVVAPTYPLGNGKTPGGATISDIDQQTGDISFLLDQYIEASAGSDGPLAGLIDPERLGAFGHSMGAITSMGVGFQDCCTDDRLDAVAEWSGLFLDLDKSGTADFAADAGGRPVLGVHGDKDPVVPYATGQAFYQSAPGPKWFVTLPGEGHVGPFVGGLESPANAVTTRTTIAFFDHFLKDDPQGIERLEAAVADAPPGIATLESANAP